MVKTVCVVGGGVSGLTAVKACLELGLQVKAYEQDDQIGGIWYYTPEPRSNQGAAAYQRLVSNDPKETICFSDFPFPEYGSQYFTHEEALNYLKAYATHFNLWEHLKLQTQVVNVRRSEDFTETGQWKVTTKQLNTNLVQEELYDAVIIAIEIFRKTSLPNIPGLDTFSGKITTSQEFRKGETFTSDTVLVIGNGISAGDMTCEISMFAKQVFLAVGPGTWNIPTHLPGNLPNELLLLTRKHAYWSSEADILLELYNVVNNHIDHENTGLACDRPPTESSTMVTNSLNMQISCGRVIVKGYVTRIDGETVHFDDRSECDNIDHILLASGYNMEYPFLETDILKGSVSGSRSFCSCLYKQVFHADLAHPTLAFVGMVPFSGPNWSAFELQARWVSGVFSGRYTLPNRTQMMKEVNSITADQIKAMTKNPHFLTTYKDEIAGLVGCKPSLWRYFLTDLKLAIQLWTGPLFSSQFRIEGPNSCPDARERFLDGTRKTVTATKHRYVKALKPGASMWSAAYRILPRAVIVLMLYLSYKYHNHVFLWCKNMYLHFMSMV